MTKRIHWTVSSKGECRTTDSQQAPVAASLGFRAAAAADHCASVARLLSPLLDVLVRLWLAEGFLVTDALQHILPGDQVIMQDHLSPSVSLFATVAATSFGIFVQTICPVLLEVGLFTRFAALALLLQADPRRRRSATAIMEALPRLGVRQLSRTSAEFACAALQHGGFGAQLTSLF
jgi:uncharacterized membrane protein YphA (DoxX/SURF4 family)